MRYQNFKSDFTAVHKFYTTDGSTQTQIAVPQHVRLTYFTAERCGCIVVERDGAVLDGCTVSGDGMTLTAAIALSKTFLGTGELICEIEEFSDNSEFPEGVRKDVTPVKMAVMLWPGKSSDDSSVESDIVIGYLSDAATAANNAATAANDAAANANKVAQECKADTEQNAKDIATNKTAIAKNTTDIASESEARAAADATLQQRIADNSEDIDTNATAIDAINALDERLTLLLGYSASRQSVTLELGENGKYVQCASRSAVANTSFAISKPFDVDACSELLIKTGFNPSDDTHKALDLSVISIYEQMERQRTVQKKDINNNPLYYVVEIEPETETEKVTTEESTTVSDYPVYTTETYTETRYLPNNEDRFVSIPDSGYYVANIPQSCKVAISYKPGVTDTTIIVEKHGAIANLISQVFGIYEHRTMVEAMVSLAERVEALEESRDKLGNATAGSLDVSMLTSNRYPTVLSAKGTPSEANVPSNLPSGLPWDGVPKKKGQFYIDESAGVLYFAVGTDSVSDWRKA